MSCSSLCLYFCWRMFSAWVSCSPWQDAMWNPKSYGCLLFVVCVVKAYVIRQSNVLMWTIWLSTEFLIACGSGPGNKIGKAVHVCCFDVHLRLVPTISCNCECVIRHQLSTKHEQSNRNSTVSTNCCCFLQWPCSFMTQPGERLVMRASLLSADLCFHHLQHMHSDRAEAHHSTLSLDVWWGVWRATSSTHKSIP